MDLITYAINKKYTDNKIAENAGTGGSGGGENGATFTPSVSAGGVLSWTNDKGLANPAPVNIKGEKGDTGPAGANGSPGKDGSDGKPGQDGKDGVSVTHSWSGTTLTVTSASGTSSANLKGEKGDAGSPGKDGYTPIKGVDYFDGKDGQDGSPGTSGKDGTSVTVKSVSESTADGGSNVVTFSDGKTLSVKNGSKGSTGADGKTPVKGTDYWTDSDKEEIINHLSERTTALRDAAYAPVPQLPANGQKIGDPVGGGGLVPDFTNAIDPAACTLNKRISSTNAIKDATGNIYTDYIPVKSTDTIRVNVPLTNLNTDYSRVKFYQGNDTDGYTFVSSSDAKFGAQFTITEENEGSVCSFQINSYNGANLGTTYDAIRLVLYIKSTAVTADDIAGLIVTVNEPITYSEAPGEKATVAADFDGNNMGAQDIYNYMDKLVAKYPRLITKEVMGKDASGAYDCCRYVFGRRAYDAWVRPNYPPMYGWTNGNTTIYSVSVSPRVGDTTYSTAYIGTAYSTVTAVDTPNQTRTVNGKVFSRNKEKDVEPKLVYTETAYNPLFVGTYAGIKNEVSRDVDGVKTRVGAITAMTGDTMSCNDGNTYNRYPLGDRDENYQLKPTILLGANEHGCNASNDGDTREPAIITARLAKDLCECDPRNAYLNMLRDKYKVVFIPIINPYGYTVGSYVNSNNVNIDRNMDTPGWGNDTDTNHGAYGGSENETQYWMNTCVSSKAVIGMANHSYGRAISADTGEIKVAGTCGCMVPRPVDAYNKYFERTEMVMTGGYNLSLLVSDHAEPENYGKTRSYMDWVGIRCCALEMQASEGFLQHGGGQMFTERVMEANYTLLLQFLHMLIECQEA